MNFALDAGEQLSRREDELLRGRTMNWTVRRVDPDPSRTMVGEAYYHFEFDLEDFGDGFNWGDFGEITGRPIRLVAERI